MRSAALKAGSGLLLLALAGVLQPAVACVAGGAVQTARWIYANQHAFTVFVSPQDTALMQRLLSPALLRLMQVEWRCQVIEEGLCALDTDPWTNSEAVPWPAPVSFAPDMAAATRANIRMRFRFGSDPSHSMAAQATLHLAKDETTGCWRLDDIVGDKGQSLVRRLRAYRFYP